MCRWCLGRINLDLDFSIVNRLQHLPSDVVAVLLPEIVEEFTAHALGASEALPFWRNCFGYGTEPSAPFFLTKLRSAEHERLWETAKDDDD